MVALGVLLTAGLGGLLAVALRGWRAHWELESLKRVYRRALESHEKLRVGLQTMAQVVPHLEKSRLAMSGRGVELLDKHTVAMMALRRAAGVSHGRFRPRRATTRELHGVTELDRLFEQFRQAVLVALYQQAVTRVVMPPMAVRRYRAAFTLLEHELPGSLWPLMDKILAQHVGLWTRDDSGGWHKVRHIVIRYGKEIVFSRRYFERAQELRLVVRDPDGRSFTNEFVVEHEPAAGSTRRLPGLFG